MQAKIFYLFIAFNFSIFNVNAASQTNIAVYSTEKSIGSIYLDGKIVYTKTFDVLLANFSIDETDLSKYCLKAYSPDNKEFLLDTVGEELTNKILKKGDSVKSFAMFSSENTSVYKAAVIKLTNKCQ